MEVAMDTKKSSHVGSSMSVAGRGCRACDMCGKDRATWYCSADDASLCNACDASVHSANSVAKRHDRVRLRPTTIHPSSSSSRSFFADVLCDTHTTTHPIISKPSTKPPPSAAASSANFSFNLPELLQPWQLAEMDVQIDELMMQPPFADVDVDGDQLILLQQLPMGFQEADGQNSKQQQLLVPTCADLIISSRACHDSDTNNMDSTMKRKKKRKKKKKKKKKKMMMKNRISMMAAGCSTKSAYTTSWRSSKKRTPRCIGSSNLISVAAANSNLISITSKLSSSANFHASIRSSGAAGAMIMHDQNQQLQIVPVIDGEDINKPPSAFIASSSSLYPDLDLFIDADVFINVDGHDHQSAKDVATIKACSSSKPAAHQSLPKPLHDIIIHDCTIHIKGESISEEEEECAALLDESATTVDEEEDINVDMLLHGVDQMQQLPMSTWVSSGNQNAEQTTAAAASQQLVEIKMESSMSLHSVSDEDIDTFDVMELCASSCFADSSMENSKKRKLCLSLDYEDILDAWSDKGSLWMDGQRPQTVPDITHHILQLNNVDMECYYYIGGGVNGGNYNNGNSSAITTNCCSHAEAAAIAGQVPVLLQMSSSSSSSSNSSIDTIGGAAAAAAGGGGGGGGGGREARVLRYREKRRTRLFAKRIRYEVRKLNAERRPRMKGRFVKRSAIAGM